MTPDACQRKPVVHVSKATGYRRPVRSKADTPRVRGDLLRKLRVAHDEPKLRTQQGLASAADVATRTVARAEEGYARFETVEELAATLGVPPWDLWIPLAGLDTQPAGDPSSPLDATAGHAQDGVIDLLDAMDAKLDKLIRYMERGPR